MDNLIPPGHSGIRPVTRKVLYLALTLVCPVLGDRDAALRAYERHDFHKALRSWQELAKKGNNPEAEFELGSMYEKGEGTRTDLREAARWYWRAAYQGFAQAQSALGMLYASGQGVSRDSIQALLWLSLASRNGMAEAAKQRDELAQTMSAVDIKEAQRLADIWEPALEAGGGVSPPVVSRPVNPDDKTARLAGYAGTVVLYLIVDPNGASRDIHVYQSVNREVDARVVHTVRQWKFRPGQKKGRAVPVQASVEFNFQRLP